MSCGARLPVYALFGAAFFGKAAGSLVFGIYMVGIAIALLYGLLLRRTLFVGKESTFIMELPPYHLPKFRNLFRHAWLRLREFIFRAGKIVLIMVTVLGFMGSIGTDGSFGNDNNEQSVLSVVGSAITPVFEPFGVEKDNWPASVALFTGLFAKEAIVGTLNSLYSIEDQSAEEPAADEGEGFSLKATAKEAFISIPVNLSEVFGKLANPLGVEEAIEENGDAENEDVASALNGMRAHFSLGKFQVFAYLLFILLYVPCLAALGTAFRELGRFYGTLMIVFQTAIGWSLSVLFFQLTVGGSALWIGVAVALLVSVVVSLIVIGRDQKKKHVFG